MGYELSRLRDEGIARFGNLVHRHQMLDPGALADAPATPDDGHHVIKVGVGFLWRVHVVGGEAPNAHDFAANEDGQLRFSMGVIHEQREVHAIMRALDREAGEFHQAQPPTIG